MCTRKIATSLAVIALCFAYVSPCYAEDQNWQDAGYGIVYASPDAPVVALLPIDEPDWRGASYESSPVEPSVTAWSVDADASALVWVKYFRLYTYLNQQAVPLYAYVTAQIAGSVSGSGSSASSVTVPWNPAEEISDDAPTNYNYSPVTWGPKQYNPGSHAFVYMILMAQAENASAESSADASVTAVWAGQGGGGGDT